MQKTQKQIDFKDLVAMDIYEDSHPISIDLMYSDKDHPENIFKTALYRKDARLWLHKEFAQVVLRASEIINQEFGGILVLKDGLRTVDAQIAMQNTDIVKKNPQWLEEGPLKLLSSPGSGGHPRGMAVDVTVADSAGKEWDMGTSVDHLTTDPNDNPAARNYKNLPEHVLENRKRLQDAFTRAASEFGLEILALPSEWWDFRFPASYSERFAAIYDDDVPANIRMTR